MKVETTQKRYPNKTARNKRITELPEKRRKILDDTICEISAIRMLYKGEAPINAFIGSKANNYTN